jgi:hypothetical protein
MHFVILFSILEQYFGASFASEANAALLEEVFLKISRKEALHQTFLNDVIAHITLSIKHGSFLMSNHLEQTLSTLFDYSQRTIREKVLFLLIFFFSPFAFAFTDCWHFVSSGKFDGIVCISTAGGNAERR